jgi:hypothetical protein
MPGWAKPWLCADCPTSAGEVSRYGWATLGRRQEAVLSQLTPGYELLILVNNTAVPCWSDNAAVAKPGAKVP